MRMILIRIRAILPYPRRDVNTYIYLYLCCTASWYNPGCDWIAALQHGNENRSHLRMVLIWYKRIENPRQCPYAVFYHVLQVRKFVLDWQSLIVVK